MKTSALEKTRQSLPGLRITNQRALILDILRHGQSHMDADEVYRLARRRQPRISLSTVYRNLQTLKKMGLVDEVHFDEAHHHYEVKNAAEPGHVPEYHHLICQKCGKIIEFAYPLADLIKTNVPEAADFLVSSTETRVLGYCSECRSKE
jgi:Fur family transcriptional regulator, ferric uptake regulator